MPANMTITARLARDPDSRTSAKGTVVTTLTLPVDTGWGDNKHTTWWRVSLFGARAETAAKYLIKGSWVAVSGTPSVRTYTKKDGTDGVSAELSATSMDFVGPKPEREASNGGQPHRSVSDFDDVPF
jgi:single-strand DNA-binding protein